MNVTRIYVDYRVTAPVTEGNVRGHLTTLYTLKLSVIVETKIAMMFTADLQQQRESPRVQSASSSSRGEQSPGRARS